PAWGPRAGCRAGPRRGSACPAGRSGPRPRTRPRRAGRGGPPRPRRRFGGTFFERLLLGGVALGGARPGAQGLEPQAGHQPVDGVQAAQDAELLPEDAPHVPSPEGAAAVGRGRAGAEALSEALLLLGRQRALAAAALEVVQAGQAPGVVARHPGADLAL